MNLREQRENIESMIFSEFASLSSKTKGRMLLEEKCMMRTEFQRDRDRIIHSKAFRRLKHKTQVFISPEGDHFRTRLTHTLEVSQIARTIGRALMLNEDLIEAIALGHDLGHTPFGHSGEYALDEILGGFRHNEQSMRVVDFLERKNDRIGLNLTYEVRDGILRHSGDAQASTLEGKIIKYADRIAYINHDIDDSIRAGVLKQSDLPKDILDELGHTHSNRINNMIMDIVSTSMGKNDIAMSRSVQDATDELRKFMFNNIYFSDYAKNEKRKVKRFIRDLFDYYYEHRNKLPESHISLYESIDDGNIKVVIADYVAGMTDRFAISKWNELFAPRTWSIY